MWLLRDFRLIFVDENSQPCTPTEYLKKHVFKGKVGESASVGVAVGRAIEKFFPSFDCRILPVPSDSDLQNTCEFSSSFNKAVEEVACFLKANVAPMKALDSNVISNGTIFAEFVKGIIEEINIPNAIPVLDNAWRHVCLNQCHKIQKKFVAKYDKVMKDRYTKETSDGKPLEYDALDDNPPNDGRRVTLMEIHREILKNLTEELLQESGQFLQQEASGEASECSKESVTKMFEQEIVQYKDEEIHVPDGTARVTKVVGGIFFQFVQRNHKQSFKFCYDLFEQLYKPIKARYNNPMQGLTIGHLRTDIEQLQSKYSKDALGPARDEVKKEATKKITSDQEMFENFLWMNERLAREAKEREKREREIQDWRQQLEKQIEMRRKAEADAAWLRNQRDKSNCAILNCACVVLL